MPSIAKHIKSVLEEKAPVCFSLTYGNAVGYNGEKLTFNTPKQTKGVEHNDKGRYIKLSCVYADNSTLTYHYNSAKDSYTLTAS